MLKNNTIDVESDERRPRLLAQCGGSTQYGMKQALEEQDEKINCRNRDICR